VRFAVISDIHANMEALAAVLGEIDAQGVDRVLCLGDIVGYNAEPEACARTVAARCAEVIRGNHDKAAAGLIDLAWFNAVAREAAFWTTRAMSADGLEAIRLLPAGPRDAGEGIVLCHGSPQDEDEYLVPGPAVGEAFRFLASAHPEAAVCLHGHTHRPFAAWRARKGGAVRTSRDLSLVHLDPAGISLLNPGSVGQPRDGNPRASFGILDTGTMTFSVIRVGYAIGETQRKILAAGLPPDLARRLGEGW
jgi:predicted phosphodiesterase